MGVPRRLRQTRRTDHFCIFADCKHDRTGLSGNGESSDACRSDYLFRDRGGGACRSDYLFGDRGGNSVGRHCFTQTSVQLESFCPMFLKRCNMKGF